MQKRGHFIFWIIIAFSVSYGIKSITLESSIFYFFQNYLFDFLFPTGFAISILIMASLLGKNMDYRVGVFISFILALTCEILQSCFGKGDPYDGIAYFLGVVFYFLIFKKEKFYISFSIPEELEEQTERLT